MTTVDFNYDDVTPQQHATFEREGWAIFNDNEVERIDDMKSWLDLNHNDSLPKGFTQLNSDIEAVERATKHGFIVKGNKEGRFTIIKTIIKN